MSKQELITEIFELGKKIGNGEGLTKRKLNDLNKRNLEFIIKLRKETLERKLSA
ncbi:MAG TPA: hypothetical protein VK093_00100 [Candidatus Avipropionibacterium sp.]|nr:hypothetical protein [Candidatus Avipropionibacterium sp.]